MKTISMWKNVGQFTPSPEIAFISTFLPPKSDIN